MRALSGRQTFKTILKSQIPVASFEGVLKLGTDQAFKLLTPPIVVHAGGLQPPSRSGTVPFNHTFFAPPLYHPSNVKQQSITGLKPPRAFATQTWEKELRDSSLALFLLKRLSSVCSQQGALVGVCSCVLGAERPALLPDRPDQALQQPSYLGPCSPNSSMPSVGAPAIYREYNVLFNSGEAPF